MPVVDSGTALYLKSQALFTKAAGVLAATWGNRAVDTEIISPLALKTAADTEAARQIAVLEGPLCEDVLVVPGRRKDLLGKVITAKGARLDYTAGKLAFVIGFQEAESTTILNVIRKVAA